MKITPLKVALMCAAVGALYLISNSSQDGQILEEVKAASAQFQGFNVDGTWVPVSTNKNFVSFVDLGSIRYLAGSVVRAKTVYVMTSSFKFGEHTADIALKTGIYNCSRQTEVIASIEYFNSNKDDDFTRLVSGSPTEIHIPQGTYASEELEKICRLDEKQVI